MSIALSEEEKLIYSNFFDSLRSPRTKDVYVEALKQFMKFHNIYIEDFSKLLHLADVEEKIKQYIINMRERGLSTSFMKVNLSAIKSFYEMNDHENISGTN